MSIYSNSMKYIGTHKSSAQNTLDTCRYKKYLIDDDVQSLYNDLYKYKKRLQRTYHNQFCNEILDKMSMRGVVDLQVYPRGVRTAPFPLYTLEGDRLPLARPASGALCEKSVITSSGRQYRYYSVAV